MGLVLLSLGPVFHSLPSHPLFYPTIFRHAVYLVTVHLVTAGPSASTTLEGLRWHLWQAACT